MLVMISVHTPHLSDSLMTNIDEYNVSKNVAVPSLVDGKCALEHSTHSRNITFFTHFTHINSYTLIGTLTLKSTSKSNSGRRDAFTSDSDKHLNRHLLTFLITDRDPEAFAESEGEKIAKIV